MEEATIDVAGMDCASCVAHVEKAARGVSGVQSARVNLARGRAVVSFDPDKTDPSQVASAITDSGYPAAPEVSSGANNEQRRVAEQAAHARSWFTRAMVGMAHGEGVACFGGGDYGSRTWQSVAERAAASAAEHARREFSAPVGVAA